MITRCCKVSVERRKTKKKSSVAKVLWKIFLLREKKKSVGRKKNTVENLVERCFGRNLDGNLDQDFAENFS